MYRKLLQMMKGVVSQLENCAQKHDPSLGENYKTKIIKLQ